MPIDLGLFATNVTKEKYYAAAANGLASQGADFAMLGEPRIYGMRLRYRFSN
jgi:iron complex outermembrane receptor protein